MGKTIAIMQPTYLPWSGYFELMDRCDLFVFLDTVQFEKCSWHKRNKIKTASGETWLTIPVKRKGFQQKLLDTEIDHAHQFSKKHLKTIEYAYKKAPFYDQYMPTLSMILEKNHPSLTDLTIELCLWLKLELGITTDITYSSKLPCSGGKVDLVVSICREVGAERYYSPRGAAGYIEENNIFLDNNIILEYQDYQPVLYQQLHGNFIPYLSVIDLLMNEGEKSLSIIRAGRKVLLNNS